MLTTTMSLMATTDTASTVVGPDTTLFLEIESYPWDTDDEFQSGLRAILGPNPAPEQAEQLTLRARCFYYARQALRIVMLGGPECWLI